MVGLFFAVGCKKDDPKGPIEYPIDIPFTEYLLAETCEWTSFESNNVIVINSDDELNDYIVCTDDNYSKIDFSKHSLLLVRGAAGSNIINIDVDFSQNTECEYVLEVLIHVGMATVAPPWLISMITTKVGNDANVSLNVQEIQKIVD